MKRIGVLYATREGQTKRIAGHIAARLRIRGFEPDLKDLANEQNVDLAEYAALLPVTLSEAGVELRTATAEERARFAADVQKMLDNFFEDTGWQPKRVNTPTGRLWISSPMKCVTKSNSAANGRIQPDPIPHA